MEKDIKIFVSRRIDIDSVTVDNPLYVPVRCGAVYDSNENSPYLGDDTGDNISEKRFPYSELTVQYWAWKNIDADYYGLCHYRRYFSFSDKKYRFGWANLVISFILDEKGMKKFGLLDSQKMRKVIEKNDMIISSPEFFKNTFRANAVINTVYELWDNASGHFFEKGTIERVFELIDELAPEYSKSAREYFRGNMSHAHICYIMRRELFDRLCQFQFPILEVIEREYFNERYDRVCAYVGEMLLSIFIYHLKKHESWKIEERQLVLFKATESFDTAWAKIKYILRDRFFAIVDILLPKKSRRRECVKNILLALRK